MLYVIVLVLYETSIANNPNYLLLKKVIEKKDFSLFIYDNSKKKQEDELFHQTRVKYVHDRNNPGLAKPYNEARIFSLNIGADFMVLLDQDTTITSKFLNEIDKLTLNEDIGAIVPLVYSKNKQISPVFSDKYINRKSLFPIAGTYKSIMAINSGSIIPRHTLEEMIEFNPKFPLDYLDHWFYWKVNKAGKKIEILDVALEHELSVLNYDNVSLARYESILSAETRFYKYYQTDQFFDYKNHLLLRIAKQFITVKNRKIWHRTATEYRYLMRGE